MKTTLNPCRTAILLVPLVLMIVSSACGFLSTSTAPAPTATFPVPVEITVIPAATLALPATSTPVPEPAAAGLSVNASEVAQNTTSLVVAAVPASPDAAWREPMPEYTLVSLQGYPVNGHLKTPQIALYPVQGLGVNETAAKAAADLQSLLQSQQAGQSLPCLPLANEKQMIHAQVSYLDFANGKGVRYLTQYSNGITPVNNHELFYTYQGLTSDGKYYLSVVMPVTLSGLPAYPDATDNLPLEYSNDFPKYLANTVNQLNQQGTDTYNPNLSNLDAMVQSIEIR